jgi:hypothetical protein
MVALTRLRELGHGRDGSLPGPNRYALLQRQLGPGLPKVAGEVVQQLL